MSYDFKISNGDFAIGSNGDFKRAENTEKLIQDILKICITPLGGNIFFPWYGSPVNATLVGNPMDMEFLSTVASGQLQNSLQALQTMQQEQAKRQKVTPFEQIAAVKQVQIERNQVDPRFFKVIISVLTRALSQATTDFTIRPISRGL